MVKRYTWSVVVFILLVSLMSSTAYPNMDNSPEYWVIVPADWNVRHDVAVVLRALQDAARKGDEATFEQLIADSVRIERWTADYCRVQRAGKRFSEG